MLGTLIKLSTGELMASTSEVSSQLFKDLSPFLFLLLGIAILVTILWVIIGIFSELEWRREFKRKTGEDVPKEDRIFTFWKR